MMVAQISMWFFLTLAVPFLLIVKFSVRLAKDALFMHDMLVSRAVKIATESGLWKRIP